MTIGLLNKAYLNPWANRGGAGMGGQQMGGFGSLSGGVQDMLGAGAGGGAGMGGFQAPNYGQQAYDARMALQNQLPSQQPVPAIQNVDAVNQNGGGGRRLRLGGPMYYNATKGQYIDPNKWREYNKNPIWFKEQGPDNNSGSFGWSALGFMEKDDQPRRVPSAGRMYVDILRGPK